MQGRKTLPDYLVLIGFQGELEDGSEVAIKVRTHSVQTQTGVFHSQPLLGIFLVQLHGDYIRMCLVILHDMKAIDLKALGAESSGFEEEVWLHSCNSG